MVLRIFLINLIVSMFALFSSCKVQKEGIVDLSIVVIDSENQRLPLTTVVLTGKDTVFSDTTEFVSGIVEFSNVPLGQYKISIYSIAGVEDIIDSIIEIKNDRKIKIIMKELPLPVDTPNIIWGGRTVTKDDNYERTKTERSGIKIIDAGWPEDSLIQVYLVEKDILFNWDRKTSRILEDTHFNRAKAKYYHSRKEIIEKILDVSKTYVSMCSVERDLVLGDFAFVFIDKVEKLPLVELFDIQWDVYKSNCSYPIGMIDYIKDNREEVKRKVELHLLR